MDTRFKISFFWMLIGIGMILHMVMRRIGLYYGQSIAMPEADGNVPAFMHYMMMLSMVFPAIFAQSDVFLFFSVGMIGVCIACASLWLLIVMVPFVIFTHLVVLGEERYCEQTYGKSYWEYKKRTARYFSIIKKGSRLVKFMISEIFEQS